MKSTHLAGYLYHLLLKKKNDLHDALYKWHQQEVKSRGFKVNRIRLDNAGEQTDKNFDLYFSSS